ncbi:MAG: type II secretion system secretin GspD, partial [Pseudomonadota bacterium]
NAVILRAPSAARANLARSIIAKLDQPAAQAGNVHVVYLKNADATKLAQTLRAVVSGDASAISSNTGGSLNTGTPGASSTGANAQQTPAGTSGGASLNQQQAAQNPTAGGSAGFIQADASTNTLIITASDTVYRNLRGVIDQLDVRRAQVFIESLIVEVNSNKVSEFGVQWAALSGDATSKYRVGGIQSYAAGTSNNLITAATSKAPGPGLTIGLFKQIGSELGLGALAHALETDGNANILSTPNMLTLDNEVSTIKVGQNVPIISGQFTTPASGTSSNPFQTIDRRDVGLTLKVRPQISEGGTIKMQIYHETSNVDEASLKDVAGVTTNIRVIENNVIADDGQIIVIGGLIKDSSSDGADRVHGLASIPILGNLFKYSARARTKTNLMVFLRPVIVRSKEESGALAADRYDYMRSAGQDVKPQETNVMLRELGSPVLPALLNGQPVNDRTMVPIPAKPAKAPAEKQ